MELYFGPELAQLTQLSTVYSVHSVHSVHPVNDERVLVCVSHSSPLSEQGR